MSVKRYDVVVPKKDARDPNKTYWRNVGTLVKFEATQDKPEGMILELHMFPETVFKVFEQKPKPAATQAAAEDAAWDTALPSQTITEQPKVEIDESSIPF